MNSSLLVELITEELPPKVLERLARAFGDEVLNGLIRAQLKTRDPRGTTCFATPRRLAVLIPDVASQAQNRVESKKLMPAKIAYGADGTPTAALMKRLEKEGATIGQLERKTDNDVEHVFLERTIAGITLVTGLQIALQEAIAKLPTPKVMSYQLADGTDARFVRPAHALVALHDSRVINVSVLGLKAGRITHGHRFQGVKDIEVVSAETWEDELAAHGKVIASFVKRREEIKRQLQRQALALDVSLGPEEDVAPLLDEVTALVEYPTVYAGEFEIEFLAVPQECLVLTMRANQKYFPLFDRSGKLTNKFLIVSNMDLKNPRNIIEGNQRVVRPRLADARFFFDTDKKIPLADRVPRLAAVVYHNQLGTQLDRIGRLRKLAAAVARAVGADIELTDRAAWLAKADLGTQMVGEFPELQGVMGCYYALADGEAPEVAQAIREHYLPRGAGDAVAASPAGIAVAIADKLDTLAGIFAIGQKPSGTKDPFGLRRAALGVVRTLIERKLDLDLRSVIDKALQLAQADIEKIRTAGGVKPSPMQLQPTIPGEDRTADDVYDYVIERLRAYYVEGAGAVAGKAPITVEMFDAVLATQPRSPLDFDARLTALAAFLELPEAASLTAANKRIANILRKSESVPGSAVAVEALRAEAEVRLFDTMRGLAEAVSHATAQREYSAALGHLAQLRPAVDAFFEQVLVMDPDAKLRANRLALLAQLRALFAGVADLSRLPG